MALHVGEGSEREQCCLLSFWLSFSHFLHYPGANWVLLVLIPGWMGLCRFLDPMGFSNEHSCEAGSLFCLCNPHRISPSEVLRFISPCWNPGLLSPQLFFWFIHMQIGTSCSTSCRLTRRGLPAAAFPGILSAPAAHLCPSYPSG